MAKKLEKPYTEKQKADFIVEYNHNKGLTIEETEKALYALEPWEKLVNGEIIENKEAYNTEKLQQAQSAKLQEATDKAFEYRDKTGVISFNGRPVVPVMPLNEQELAPETITVHTELLNQDDMFQRVIGSQQGIFTDDQIYNTKEDIPVYLNEQEAQAIYFAIVARAQKLWVEDYMVYKSLIDSAKTADEVNAIVIDYDNVPVITEPEQNEVTEDVKEDTTNNSEVAQNDV